MREPNRIEITLPPGYGADVLEWSFGQTVFLKCDEEQKMGMVTGIVMRPLGVGYYVSWGDRSESFHYVFELTTEKEFQTA